MSPALRPARSLDAGQMGAMISEAVTARAWKPRLHSGAEDIAHADALIARGWVTVAETPEGGAVAGFLAREGSYVHALFIAPAWQRRGIGRALIARAKAASPALDLWTFAANTAARRFYEDAGFAEIARGDGSENEEGLPEIHYRWSAPDTETAAKPDTASKEPGS